MGRVIKKGRVVVILRGRYAGKKAVVLSAAESGQADRPYPHAIVAGLERAPRKVTRKMQKWDREHQDASSKVDQRLAVKPFVKYINLNHLMPTRYNLDIAESLASLVNTATLQKKEKLEAAKGEVKKVMQDRWLTVDKLNKPDKASQKAFQGALFFFKKLQF